MEPIQLIDNSNLRSIIGNNPINVPNANVPNASINRISGPSVISTIDKPNVRGVESPVIRGLEVPIVNVPNTAIKYPVINVPTQAEFDAAVKAEREKQQQEEKPKERGLPDTTPPPQLPQVAETPPAQTPIAEIPADKPTTPTFSVYGVNVNLPDPSLVATAGAVAVVTTAATIASTTVLNALKNAAEPMIKEATKNKFKIKIKQVKPVLHYVLAEGGHVDVFEYSAEGTRLVEQVSNVEQYIRDQVEINALYEIDNKIIIDDIIKDKFTKEGKERFKPLFAPAKKIAKKLSAKFSI
jgi:hypothetical protein